MATKETFETRRERLLERRQKLTELRDMKNKQLAEVAKQLKNLETEELSDALTEAKLSYSEAITLIRGTARKEEADGSLQ